MGYGLFVLWFFGMLLVSNVQMNVVEGYWFDWTKWGPSDEEKRYTWPLGGWTAEGFGHFATVMGGWVSLALILLFDYRYGNLSRFLPWGKQWSSPPEWGGEFALQFLCVLLTFVSLAWFAISAGVVPAGAMICSAVFLIKM